MTSTEERKPYVDPHCDAAEKAAERCEFALTYARTEPRELAPGMILGPDIDDVYHPGQKSSGEWMGEVPDGYHDAHPAVLLTEDVFIDHYAGMAINEAVHEALEWFRVDGKPWLDPHGPTDSDIYAAVAELVEKLTSFRHGLLEQGPA